MKRVFKSKYINQAGLNFNYEEPYLRKLRKLKNIILTHHIGSYLKK